MSCVPGYAASIRCNPGSPGRRACGGAHVIRRPVNLVAETGGWSHAWRALRHPNFRLFFGQSISVIGTWLTQVARMWLVFRLTHSALLLGVVSFAGQFVSFVFSPRSRP